MSAKPGDLGPFNRYRTSKAIQALKNAIAGKPDVWFVRWNAVTEPPETEGTEASARYWESLEQVVETFDGPPPLFRLSHREDSGAKVHLLRDLVCCYWRTNTTEKSDVLRALKALNYSALLEQAVIARLRRTLQRKNAAMQPASPGPHVVVASLDSGARADEAINTVLGWIERIGPGQRVVVFAREKPTAARVTEFLFKRRDLLDDVSAILDVKRESPAETQKKSSWFMELLRQAVGKLAQKKVEAASPVLATELKVDPKLAEDWAYLIARLAAPNLSVVDQLVAQWDPLSVRLNKLIQSEIEKRENNAAANPHQLLDLDINNREECYRLDGRLRFLTLFKVLHPKAYAMAARDAEGADQLYRLHLILVGESASDSLVSSALLPEWSALLDDSTFRELFQSCFTMMRHEAALVSRFESRLQLQNHLLWLEDDQSGETSAATQPTLQNVSKLHREWLKELAKRTGDDDEKRNLQLPPPDALLAAIKALQEAGASAADSLQTAQILLSVAELSDDFQTHKEVFDFLVTDAVRASRGGIRFDANLTQARALAFAGRSDAALRLLRIQKRIAGDALRRLAVDIESAFAFERDKDFFQARLLYQKVISAAEELGADELVARAASGCLRCDVVMNHPDNPAATRALRAQIMLRIQSARAIELAPLSERKKPKLFLSYRRDTRLVTNGLEKALKVDGPNSLFETFVDWKSIRKGHDFSPAIHSGLMDSDGVVLLLSEDYFNSPWCVHELHFALGQHDVRGIALFWTWCERARDGTETPAKTPEEALRDWLKEKFEKTDIALRGYTFAHLEDRIKRVVAYGCRLTDNIVSYSPPPPLPGDEAAQETGDLETGLKLRDPIHQRAKRIYERARLPFPEGPEPTEQQPGDA